MCLFIICFLEHKYSFKHKNIQYLPIKIKIKITLQEVRKRGKLEEYSTDFHRKLPHIISKLLIAFVLSQMYQISVNMEIVSEGS